MSDLVTVRPSEAILANTLGLFRKLSKVIQEIHPHRQYNSPMFLLRALLATLLLTQFAAAQEHVSFPTEDGGVVYADIYGKGERGVVLAHGGRFNKESWVKQALALAKAGFRALAIDFRGRGQSRGPQSKSGDDGVQYDVLAAVRYLHKTGAKSVSVIGASFGGQAAADATIEAEPGEIDRLVLLAAWTDRPPEKIKGRKLFIVARDDANDDGRRLPKIRANYEKAVGPKELVILDGSAHAQFLFATDQGERLMREILRFLSQP
jgi:pimeloyl-ACP methyl ester carboxylesterase